jgi:diketogulonate reductase-like aldo/keto reductase
MRLLLLVALSNYLFIQKSTALTASNQLNRRDVLSVATVATSRLIQPSGASAQQGNTGGGVVAVGAIPFPLVSFGLQIYDDDTAYRLTLTALEVGYRNFFASVLARNQRGFARAVRDSGVPRSDLFICGSVVSNQANGFEEANRATVRGWQENMNAFAAGSIDYLDQIMLDYPGPGQESIRGQWRAFEAMEEQKYTRTLSVSNFSPSQIDSILSDPTTRVKPVLNQLPYSVAYHPESVISDNASRGILVQAWAPLGGSLGGRFDSRIKSVCSKVGSKYNKSGAQVALRWIIQTGGAVCTQTKKKEHFIEDLDIFDFDLSKEDMETLDALA